LSVIYGLDVKSADEDVHHILIFIFSPTANVLNTLFLWQYIVDSEAVLVIICKYLLPGAHVVDFFPFRMLIQLHSHAFVFFLLTQRVYLVKHIPNGRPLPDFIEKLMLPES
jgi:hypothetical protein